MKRAGATSPQLLMCFTSFTTEELTLKSVWGRRDSNLTDGLGSVDAVRSTVARGSVVVVGRRRAGWDPSSSSAAGGRQNEGKERGFCFFEQGEDNFVSLSSISIFFIN